LKKRGDVLTDIKVSHKKTRPVRVCNLCYMLVVAEHELIEVLAYFLINLILRLNKNSQKYQISQ